MFCHIGLQETTTEISSYKICTKLLEGVQLAEHECGTWMMVLRHVLAVLCEITPILTEG
jgi:hypothetical protein